MGKSFFQLSAKRGEFLFFLCLEIQNKQIEVFGTGFKKITNQNFIRKLISRLELNSNFILISVTDPNYEMSKNYKKFLEENSERLRLTMITPEEMFEINQFLENFKNYRIKEKTWIDFYVLLAHKFIMQR